MAGRGCIFFSDRPKRGRIHTRKRCATRPNIDCLARYENDIKRDLIINHRKLFAEFLIDALPGGDFDSRMSGYAMAIQNEILSRNEVREMENRNPVPGGDEFRNPLSAPQRTEPTEDEDDSTNARVLRADIGEIDRELWGAQRRVLHRVGGG